VDESDLKEEILKYEVACPQQHCKEPYCPKRKINWEILGKLKQEWLNDKHFKAREDAKRAVFGISRFTTKNIACIIKLL